MTPSPETKAAVVAAHGGDASAAEVGRAHGLTRNQVIGLWNRRPRGTPEEVARVLARQREAEAAKLRAFTPEAPAFTGQRAAFWSALMAGGHDGATADDILAAVYPDRDRPASWRTMLFAMLKVIRLRVGEHGFGVDVVPGVHPSRWRVVRAGGEPYVASHLGAAGGLSASPATTISASARRSSRSRR